MPESKKTVTCGYSICATAITAGVILAFLLITAAPLGCTVQITTTQPSPSPPPIAAQNLSFPNPLPQDLLAYEKEVEAENLIHEKFLDDMDSRLEVDVFKFLGAGLIIIGGLFTWFNLKTSSDLKRNMASKIAQRIDTELPKQIDIELPKQLEKSKSSIAAQFEKRFEDDRIEFLALLARQNYIHSLVSDSMIELNIIDERGRDKISNDEEQSAKRTMTKVEAKLNIWRDSRGLAIQVGRFYVELERNVEQAIRVLEETLNYRKEATLKDRGGTGDEIGDEDDAALLYNLACYQNKIIRSLKKKGSAEDLNKAAQLQQKAEAAIAKSIQIDPTNGPEAGTDPDLDDLTLPSPYDKLRAKTS